MKILKDSEKIKIHFKNEKEIITDQDSLLGAICERHLATLETSEILILLINSFFDDKISKDEVFKIKDRVESVIKSVKGE